jgi:hypothetical protein
MTQKTDLNVSPYYDDFDETDNFQRTLFRPGFAIQARELTQLQSTLQNQIEKHGSHIFKEGAVVIPGAIAFNDDYYSLKLASTFASETVDPSQYFNSTTPVTITGVTTGVTAVVVGFDAATTTDQPTLYIRYLATGTDNVTRVFADGENISANAGVTHTTAYSTDIASSTTYTSLFSAGAGSTAANLAGSTGPASRQGSAVHIQAGVYYVRGFFVTCSEETFVLDKYSDRPSYRVGFTITETLVTPESDTTLLDNATGANNYAAKGAHRLKISLALSKLDRGSTADGSFIELIDVKNGVIQSMVRATEYSVLEETLARRTFDESGDYTVRPFQFNSRECVDTSVGNEDFTGAFIAGASTDDGNTASTDLLTLQVSPGKAYIKGYEIERVAPSFKDINKARDFDTVNAGVSSFNVGNFAFIKNVYGTPDVTFISGESTAFKTLEFYDDFNTTRGAANGSLIGVGRARSIEYSTGTVGASATNFNSQYKLFMFDLQPFTKLTLSDTPSPTLLASHANGGVQIKGVNSGATGLVFKDGTSSTSVNLTNVVGTFSSGEKVTASDSAETGGIIENSGNVDLTISKIETFSFVDFRQVFMGDDDSGQDFTADFVTEQLTNVFADVLLENGTDVVELETTGGSLIQEGFVTEAAKLKETEKNRAMFKLPKKVIKTLLTDTNGGVTDTQYTVRRQFTGTTNGSGVVTFSAGSNEAFVAFAEKDYTLSILTAGDGTGAQGDIVSVSGKVAGTGSGTLTITDATILGDSAKVKVTATILKTSVSHKIKTTNLMKQVKVTDAVTHAFGTRPTDRTISLGRADVFNLVAVFDSESADTDASTPELTVGTITGTFTRGEKITGSSSGATGRIIDTTSPMSFVAKTGTFTTSDTITGASSGATGLVSAVSLGSDVITSRYELDTGQRDNFYDIARIVLKPGSSTPTGHLLVIYDYFEHGSGDVLTVDSYVDVADQMDYEDIPTYSATKVDPDAPKPSGEFPLADTYDFRPRVEDITGASSTLTTVDEITGNSFNFFARQYDGTGSSTVDVCQPGSFIQSDFEFFLPKIAVLSMTSDGNILVNEGVGAEIPSEPKVPENTMKLATVVLPAYTFKPSDVRIVREKNQRFTMRDIGELERRIDNVEYYTALSLLERDAASFEITDANGLSRFKSGFVVDNFSGFKLSDTQHKDFECSIDMQKGHLRPKSITKGLFLEENISTDAARTSVGYQKTGDLITLPYTEEAHITQPYASRVEKVTPYLTHSWVGIISLSPDSDEWFETEVAPELIINVDGNFSAVTSANENQLGTVWNAWETQWSGSSTRIISSGGEQDATTLRTTTTTQESRSGVRTEVVENVDRESLGLRVINRAVIPILRSRTITFIGNNFRPNTRLYVFFDKTDVGLHITPASSTYSDASTPIAGINGTTNTLISDPSGKVEGTFLIPDPKVQGNIQFKTGELQFRLTSSSKNLSGSDASIDGNATADTIADSLTTAGQAIFFSQGILETSQESIIATRNATITQTKINQERSTSSSRLSWLPPIQDPGDSGDGGGGDPLSQTFTVQGENPGDGKFITSIDVFFSEKDDTLPVIMEIRNTVNGYPGAKILPFGRVVKAPADVNLSDTGATATTFTFDSPVYLKDSIEYCVTLMSHVDAYKVWISRMGENDVGDNRIISDQPHLGILFKSSNNTAWKPSYLEDLKFTLKTAKFTTNTAGTVTLQNSTLPVKTLDNNSIIMTGASTALQVKHRNHHMYATSNNVTISGVSTDITTTLNGAITAAATSLTLTSGTNFDNTSGKYSNSASSEWWIKIDDEIMKYTAISTNAVSSVTRGEQGTTAATHADGATVELFIIHKVPLYEINKTHTAIANIGIDSYTVALSSSPVTDGSTGVAELGGASITATENSIMDYMKTIIGVMELPNTSIASTIRPTTATSPNGSQTSFSTITSANARTFSLNENYKFAAPHMVCSAINETNELSGLKSCFVDLTLNTTSESVSPVIDLQRSTLLSIANRLNNIDSSSDVFPTTEFFASTEPDGDNNATVYLTKQIALENPATALKVLFAGHRPSTSEIKVLFKILRTDDASDFDDLGYKFFNTTGVDDQGVPASADEDDFKEYIYTAGVTDDGIGDPLDEFVSFQIKIVIQGTNCAEPPRIKELRALALVT